MFKPMAANTYAGVVGAISSPAALEMIVMMSMDQPTLCCLPKMPCGRTSRTMMRIASALA